MTTRGTPRTLDTVRQAPAFAAPPVTVRVATGPQALTDLARRGWDDLMHACGSRDALRSVEVLTLGGPEGWRAPTPRAILAERDGVLVAAAPLGVRRERGLVTVRHLGHPCGWIAPQPPAIDGQSRRALLEALLRQSGDMLVLEDMPESDGLVQLLRERTPRAEITPGPVTYIAETNADTPTHRKRRKEAAATARRADRLGTPIRVDVTADWWGRIEPRLDELLLFQAECRDGMEMDPFTATPGGRDLARRMIAAVGERGGVRLATVEVAGRLAAYHLSLVAGNHAVGFKTAASRRHRGLSGLGWCSLLALHDHLAAEGVLTENLGFGGDAHKRQIARAEPLVTVRVGLSPAGRAYLAALRTGGTIVQRLRPSHAAAGGAGAWATALAPALGMA